MWKRGPTNDGKEKRDESVKKSLRAQHNANKHHSAHNQADIVQFNDRQSIEVLGHASKVVLTKDTSTIVGDGSTQEAVNKRVAQIKNLIEAAEQDYEREKLNERIAKLSGGVAVIQVGGAQTETELKEKKLRVEDALNATKAAVEEGIVVGGGCTLLRLASKVDAIKDALDNDEEKVGADVVKRALSYPLKLIAKNAGVNGSVVSEKIFGTFTLSPLGHIILDPPLVVCSLLGVYQSHINDLTSNQSLDKLIANFPYQTKIWSRIN
ncbi:hypothetical protein Pyn_09977 [Prunus yedoensis var. nudiflora]|uniref:RuBisCO large subunit-binding protein subunit beta chloroplastic n=1 Tax=Prunus yedoensis var. nudiflora TaxID=2094558 RepID=A0A314XRQ8_PRUYE|nr:hypothetical protein Pyn_09977 [Prunus yedoensis var. nudiflora]